jgi:hypothetical protein
MFTVIFWIKYIILLILFYSPKSPLRRAGSGEEEHLVETSRMFSDDRNKKKKET